MKSTIDHRKGRLLYLVGNEHHHAVSDHHRRVDVEVTEGYAEHSPVGTFMYLQERHQGLRVRYFKCTCKVMIGVG